MKIINKLVRFFLIVISTSLFFGSYFIVRAEETKYETDYAVDIFGKSIDDGIGIFVGKTTSDEAISYNPQYVSNSYYIFEWKRKDTSVPVNGSYVIINSLAVPQFVKQDIDNSEVMFGIKNGIWVQTEITYIQEVLEYKCYLEKDYENKQAVVYGYLDFIDLEIDNIKEIEFIYNIYLYVFKWWKFKSVWETVEQKVFLKPDEVRRNDKEITKYEYFMLEHIWNENPLKTLETPFVSPAGETFRFKIYLTMIPDGYVIQKDNMEEPKGITYMYYESKGVTYYTDNLDMTYFEVYDVDYKPDNDSFLDKIIDFIKSLLPIILIFFIIYIVFNLLYILKRNNFNENKKR